MNIQNQLKDIVTSMMPLFASKLLPHLNLLGVRIGYTEYAMTSQVVFEMMHEDGRGTIVAFSVDCRELANKSEMEKAMLIQSHVIKASREANDLEFEPVPEPVEVLA